MKEAARSPGIAAQLPWHRKASRNRWPSRRLCVSTTLDEIIKGSCSIRNEDFFCNEEFWKGKRFLVLVICVGLRFFMFFFLFRLLEAMMEVR